MVVDYAKRNEKFEIVGGGLAAQGCSTSDAVKALAPIAVARRVAWQAHGLIQTPATRLVGLLQAPGGQLARVLRLTPQEADDGPEQDEAA